MKIGVLELVVIFVVALLVIGPDKLPAYAQRLGLALREFRKVSADVTEEVRESVIEPLEEAQKPLREAIEPLTELDKEIRKDIKDLEKDFQNIGKPKATEPEKPQPEPAPVDAAACEQPEEGSVPSQEAEAINETLGGENT